MNIVFFKGRIDMLDYYNEKLLNAVRDNGIGYYVVDTDRPETYQSAEFDRFVKQPQCIAFLFNQIGLLLTDEKGDNLWEANRIPVFSFIVDHPRYFADAFSEPIEMLRVISLDRNHVSFIRRYFPKIRDVFFMPNGGAVEETPLSFHERKLQVVYMGNCQREPVFPDIPELKNNGADLYQYCCMKMIAEPGSTTEDVIESYFDGQEVLPNELEKKLLLGSKCPANVIEDFVRRYFKQSVMQALDQAGIEVDVYGDYWENTEYVYGSHMRFHGRISVADSGLLLGNAKIALNFMPWFKDGCSERVFNNMLNGAVCMTDESGYLKERFRDGRELVFFDLRNPSQLAEDIRWLLDHPKEAAEIAGNGQRVATENDTWELRFESLLPLMEAALCEQREENA